MTTSKSTLAFGIDVGGTRTKYGLVDLARGDILTMRVKPTPTSGLDAFVAEIALTVEEMLRQAKISRAQIVAVGVGLPGYVDRDHVSLIHPNVRFLEGHRLRPSLEAKLDLPVRMDNDARAIALGEAHVSIDRRMEQGRHVQILPLHQ